MNRRVLSRILYWVARNATYLFFRLGWRLRIIGRENVPMSGPLIVSANHRSFADPPLLGISLSRRVHFLAKRELFRFRPFGWLISNLNAHPLNRKGDVGAFKTAMKVLEDNEPMIVFPEGKRNKTDGFLPAKAGVGMLAVLAKAPILPVYIHNSAEMKRLKRITVVFGTPIRPDGFGDYQALAAEVMKRISDMREQLINAEPDDR